MWLTAMFHRRQRRRNDPNHLAFDASSSTRTTSRSSSVRVVTRLQTPNARRGQGSTRNQTNGTTGGASNAASMPMLYALARSWAWEAVAFRAQTHPEEAATNWTDHHGDNILHWSAFGRPPLAAVQALLTAGPELPKVRNNNGLFPLHVACSYRASNEVIQCIVDAYPEACWGMTDSGSYPLHILCDYGCSVESLCSVLQTEAGATTVSLLDRTFRRTPLHILNGRKNPGIFFGSVDAMRDARMRQRALRLEGAVVGVVGHQQEELDRLDQVVATYRENEFWKKASLLVLVEYRQMPLGREHVTDTDLLQACIASVECPPSVQEFALLLYEDVLLIPNENGQLPLHTAILNGTPSLLLDVLAANTSASCVRNQDGLLPLELAVGHDADRSWSQGPGRLVEAHPAALAQLHLDDRLYPKIWSRISSLDALFRAIRTRPDLLLPTTEPL